MFERSGAAGDELSLIKGEKTYRVSCQDGDKLGSSNDFQNSFRCTFVQPLPFLDTKSRPTLFLTTAHNISP